MIRDPKVYVVDKRGIDPNVKTHFIRLHTFANVVDFYPNGQIHVTGLCESGEVHKQILQPHQFIHANVTLEEV